MFTKYFANWIKTLQTFESWKYFDRNSSELSQNFELLEVWIFEVYLNFFRMWAVIWFSKLRFLRKKLNYSFRGYILVISFGSLTKIWVFTNSLWKSKTSCISTKFILWLDLTLGFFEHFHRYLITFMVTKRRRLPRKANPNFLNIFRSVWLNLSEWIVFNLFLISYTGYKGLFLSFGVDEKSWCI